jgi:hypothetical protein
VKKSLLLAALLALLVVPSAPAFAAIGANGPTPAATLLLPYFEVDLANPGGVNTLFTVANASASAGVVHVTLWTELGIPTYAFDIYLTGFDAETVDLRLLFQGIAPISADDGSDPTDRISPQGIISQDINFPGAVPPCANGPIPRMSPAQVLDLQRAHTGLSSSIRAGWNATCGARPHGDDIARGFVTIDDVVICSDAVPTDPGYFTDIIGRRNIWFGEFLILDRENNFAIGDALAHVEASYSDPRVTDPAAHTFYGWVRGYAGTSDSREPLPTAWRTRYVDAGAFDGGTDLLVWRAPPGPVGTFACGGALPAPFPLPQRYLAVFDEQENPFVPAAGSYFPVAAERVPVSSLSPPSPFGFLHLDLKRGSDPSPGALAGVGQSWISTDLRATGRFSVGFGARALDNALDPFLAILGN